MAPLLNTPESTTIPTTRQLIEQRMERLLELAQDRPGGWKGYCERLGYEFPLDECLDEQAGKAIAEEYPDPEDQMEVRDIEKYCPEVTPEDLEHLYRENVPVWEVTDKLAWCGECLECSTATEEDDGTIITEEDYLLMVLDKAIADLESEPAKEAAIDVIATDGHAGDKMSNGHDATPVAAPAGTQPHIEAIRFDISGSILKYSSREDVVEMLGGIADTGACSLALAATPDGGWAPVRPEQLCEFVLGDVEPFAPEGWEPAKRPISEMAPAYLWEELANEAHTRGMQGDETACRDYFFFERCAHMQELAYRDEGKLPKSVEGDMYLILDGPGIMTAGAIKLLERLFETEAVFSFEVSIDGVWWTYSYLDLDRVLH